MRRFFLENRHLDQGWYSWKSHYTTMSNISANALSAYKETKLNCTDLLAFIKINILIIMNLEIKWNDPYLNAGQTSFTQLLKIFHDINILKIHIQNVMTSLPQLNIRIPAWNYISWNKYLIPSTKAHFFYPQILEVYYSICRFLHR